MKNLIALVAFTGILMNGLVAQNKSLNWLGINASASAGELIRYGKETDGGISYNGKIGFLIGFGFTRVINDRFDFESGVEYSRHSFNSSYINDLGQSIRSFNPENVDLISVPANIRMKFRKQFFVTGGIQYDQRFNVPNPVTIDNQTGIGLNLKFGKEFKLSGQQILCVSPEVRIHSIVPFFPEKNQQRLTEIGLRLGHKFGL
ncbi:MAG: hypothetical protein JNL03_09525 [Prolixibacteraceae bacterium]|nr:hypothetical protein [Prolixibacteraceae bacterium]